MTARRERQNASTAPPSLQGRSLRYFSAFSGIGGFELGIRQAAPHWQCAGFSEIDKSALAVYNRHFPYHTNYGDIIQIHTDHVPDFDLLVGGFPCQPFSQAGRRRGLDDSRGGPVLAALFRLIKAKNPALLLLENVKGLLSQDGGRTFRNILQRLDTLGYDTEWQILDSQIHGGVPQRRERVYLFARLRSSSGRPCGRTGTAGNDGPAPSGSGGEIFPLAGVRTEDQSLASSAAGTSGTSGTSGATSGSHAALSLHARRTERNKVGEKPETLKRLGLSQRHFFTLTTRPDAALLLGCGDLSRFEEGKHLSEVIEPKTFYSLPIRRLTPLEWERLQGFPDGWTAGAGLSDAQRYRCLGNAVTVGVVRTVVARIQDRVCNRRQGKFPVKP
ncbi:MAG: DNA (cytosine-5-)-methyltransferase [Armatimonadota bacterium]